MPFKNKLLIQLKNKNGNNKRKSIWNRQYNSAA